MLTKNRGWITENQEFIPVQDSVLRRRKILHTQETPAFSDRLGINLCAGADDAAGIELKPDGVPSTPDLAQPDRIERGVACDQLGPCLFLPVEQPYREFRE